MNKFMQENYALVVGITLPMALMMIFFVAGRSTKNSAPDPQYDVVYANNYYDSVNQPYTLHMTDGKLVIDVNASKIEQYTVPPSVYIFDHKTMSSRMIDIDFKNVVDGKVADDDLVALNKNNLSTAAQSPDGYTFEYRPYRSGSGLAGELFGFGRHNDYYMLKNGTRYVPLSAPQMISNGKFIAWSGVSP